MLLQDKQSRNNIHYPGTGFLVHSVIENYKFYLSRFHIIYFFSLGSESDKTLKSEDVINGRCQGIDLLRADPLTF